MEHDLPLLMTLRVLGTAPAARVSTAIGCNADAALASLVERGLATERTGPISGSELTSLGREILDELLAKEGVRGSVVLDECYERFLALNKRVLQASSDWQVRREGGEDVPNDHSDAHYDDEVIDRLAQINERARACLDKMASCSARFARYSRRLDACVDRLRSGDRTAFTAPLAESYHTVWFELHQDLLVTLGLKREE